MADVDIKIDGMEEVKRLLNTLPNVVSARIQQDLAMKAAQMVKKDLQDAAANVEGDNDKAASDKLSSNVVVKKTDKGAIVGFTKRVWYVKLIEMGTGIRENKSGANRGSMPKTPFIEKSHEESAPKALEFLQKNFLKIINTAIKKQLKRVKRG